MTVGDSLPPASASAPSSLSADSLPPGVDPTRPSAGRIYDLFLGGTDYLEVDLKVAEVLRQLAPEAEDGVWANRGFLQRSARWMALEGVDQFIDIGAGLPTRNNTHEAVQSVNPDARTVYVDNDTMILAHARSLLEGTPNTAYISGDFRDPDSVLGDPELRAMIDFDKPVGLMLTMILHFVSDDVDPVSLVHRYLDALAPGSYLALSHGTSSRTNPDVIERAKALYANATEQLHIRTEEEINQFFDGLDFVPPYDGAPAKLTYVGLWGAEDPEAADSDGSRWVMCGVGRKPRPVPEGVDTSRPAAARVYDYILGGEINYAVDRQAVEHTKQGVPELPDIAWSNRGFHQRAAKWLAESAGIRQFLDIGSGLPTQNNTHEVVQRVAPDAHVVYVDIDPMVKAHAADLLRGSPHTAVITGDVRDPDGILLNADVRSLIDFSQPVALFMTGLLMLVSDESDPAGLLRRYLDALAPGSYLALTHPTGDRQAPDKAERMSGVLGRGGSFTLRPKEFVEGLFAGLEFVPPYPDAEAGLTWAGLWGAEDPESADSDGSRWMYCGVARKPA